MKDRKAILVIIALSLSLILLFLSSLMLGNYAFLSPRKIYYSLFNKESITRTIVLNLRLPRSLMAILAGSSLGLAGLLYQEIFRNKLVSPDLLGVSSGSSVGACLSIYLDLPFLMITLFSFVFGIFTVLLTLFIAKIFKNRDNLILILSGIIVSSLMSSILSFLKYILNDEVKLSSITFWLMGSFAEANLKKCLLLFLIIILPIIIALILSWRINILSLGRNQSQVRGFNYKLYYNAIIGISTLLTSSCTALCGVVSWVGLICPHIVRLFTKRDTSYSIPLTLLFSANFMLFCDIISRTFTSSDIPISAVSGLLGSVIFSVILFFKKYETSLF